MELRMVRKPMSIVGVKHATHASRTWCAYKIKTARVDDVEGSDAKSLGAMINYAMVKRPMRIAGGIALGVILDCFATQTSTV